MSKIKNCFTSRFLDGQLFEADYSQLEIVVLAYLADDLILKKDLWEGADLHTKSAAEWLCKPESEVTPDERRTAKSMTFLLQYGGGASALARQTGISKQQANNFINAYYERYRGVYDYHNKLIKTVTAGRYPSVHTTKSGIPAGISKLYSETGRSYTFIEEDTGWAENPAFVPTKIKNYPVQGFATGDIMPIMRGRLYRHIRKQERLDNHILLINTVHDDVRLDVDCGYEKDAENILKTVLESVPEVFEEKFNITLDIPIRIEIKCGPNWGEMKSIYKTAR